MRRSAPAERQGAGLATRLLLGTEYAHEILCTAPFAGFRVWFGQSGSWRDVTDGHLFLGYRPGIVGIPGAAGVGELRFGLDSPARALARLSVVPRGAFAGCPLYGVVAAEEQLLSPRQRLGAALLANRARAADVELDALEQRAVTSLYCVPRPVLVGSVEAEGGMLQFPVDLFGPVDAERWLLSLRSGGASGRWMRQTGRLRLSAPPPDEARLVYSLGPNHMGQPGPGIDLPTVGSWTFRVGRQRPVEGLHELHELLLESAEPPEPRAPTLHHLHRSAVLHCERLGLRVPVVPR